MISTHIGQPITFIPFTIKENVKVETDVKVENSQDITNEPFEHPDLKKIRELEEKHKDCEV